MGREFVAVTERWLNRDAKRPLQSSQMTQVRGCNNEVAALLSDGHTDVSLQFYASEIYC